jgi:type II secretory pathway pseudopilin PulG
MIEMLVVVVLIGFLVALAGPVAGKLIRRSEDMAALATVRQVLAVARLEAVKRSANVVVEVSEVSSSDKRIRLHTFADRANDATTPLPADEAAAAGNCIRDIGFIKSQNLDGSSTDEATLGDVTLSLRIHFWKQGGSEDPVNLGAVLFDSCGGNASVKDIVFLPGGGISLPSSGPATPTGGRGIYFADWQGKNYFRVTVESDFSAKARVDKYIEGSGYYPPSPARRWSWL